LTRNLRRVALAACLALFGCASGCTRPAPPASPVALPTTPLAQPIPLGGAAASRVSGPINTVTYTPRASASYSAAPPLNLAAPSPGPSQGNISLDFADTDIRAVVGQILGTILQQNYTIDAAVQGTATLRTVTPLARDALIPTLQVLLAQNGAVLVRDGDIYRVMPADKAAASPALAGDNALGGSAVIPLRYADAAELATVLQPYVSNGGKIVADPDQNAIIVEGDPGTRAALTNLIDAFDVDELAGQSYELFPVTSGDAGDFATAFTSALGKSASSQSGQTGSAGPITVVPLERINAVLVIARAESFLFDAQRVYAVLNQVQRETVRSWHVYYVQNGQANDAAYVLQQAFTPDNVTAQPTPQASGQVSSALSDQSGGGSGGGSSGGSTGGSGLGGSGLGGSDDSGGSGGSGGIGGVMGSSVTGGSGGSGGSSDQSGGTPPAAAPSGGSSAAALLGPLSSGGGSGTADTLRIIPDNQNNALLIYATAAENDRINAMLAKIDITPVQVRIDATVAEVDLTGALQYGTQFFFKSGGINALLTQGSSAALTTNFPGFVLSGYGSDAAPLAISLLQSVTKVNVLSSPELMVLDGQPASLQVGDLVPYLTQSSQSTITSTSEVVNSIDYRETGVILQVTPHVGSDGLVTMDVAQEVSGVLANTTTGGINSPTFSERAVTSRVAIQDGQTIGLAGLISDSDSHANAGVPYLKNVPLLGDLFGNQNNTRSRTELLVLITPHVIHTQQDAADLTEDLREQLPNAAQVPATLQSTPVGGSADPDQYLRAQVSQ
jgi:general secretion pathway protein D